MKRDARSGLYIPELRPVTMAIPHLRDVPLMDIRTGLVLDLDFLTATSSRINDLSSTAAHGTITGAVRTTKAGAILGLNPVCYEFDGVDDSINCGDANALDDLGPVSYESLFYPETAGEGNSGWIIGKGDQSTDANFTAFEMSGTIYRLIVKRATTSFVAQSETNTLILNRWNHLLVTWDGNFNVTRVNFYINGAATDVGTGTNGSGARVSDTNGSMMVGNDDAGANTFDGFIAVARVWNRELSASEARQMFNYRMWQFGNRI